RRRRRQRPDQRKRCVRIGLPYCEIIGRDREPSESKHVSARIGHSACQRPSDLIDLLCSLRRTRKGFAAVVVFHIIFAYSLTWPPQNSGLLEGNGVDDVFEGHNSFLLPACSFAALILRLLFYLGERRAERNSEVVQCDQGLRVYS